MVRLAYANFFRGNWAEAAAAARKALIANPGFSVPCYLLTAALVRLGHLSEARSSAERLLELQPDFNVGGLVAGNITTDEQMDLLADSLRDVGLPN